MWSVSPPGGTMVPAMVHQVRQHAELERGGQLHGLPVTGHRSGAQVQRDRPAADLGARHLPGAPDQRAQPREQLLEPERLREVVVGAGVDSLDGLVPAAWGGQHQDGDRDPRVAPASKHREPVNFRQAQIEHDRVVALRLFEEIGALPVGRAVHRVPGVRERVRASCRDSMGSSSTTSTRIEAVIAHSPLNET